MITIYYCLAEVPDIPTDISEYRFRKIVSARRGDDRTRMINAAKVLKAGFADFGVCEKDVIYAFSENGKPYAKNYPYLHFSLAHSGDIAICAFNDNTIGIDCEKNTRIISKEIIERYFSKRECAAFSNEPLLLWVAKEAMVKHSGKGLALGRSVYEIPYFEDELELYGHFFKRLTIEGYTVVICTDRKDEVTVKKIN